MISIWINFWPFHCNISSLYRVLARRIIRTAVRWANDDFLRELVNIIIRRDGGDSDRDGLILHNNALPSNPHVVSTSNYIYYLLLLFFFVFCFFCFFFCRIDDQICCRECYYISYDDLFSPHIYSRIKDIVNTHCFKNMTPSLLITCNRFFK